MIGCTYCETKSLHHVEPYKALMVLSRMSNQDRATILQFIDQVRDNTHYHSNIATSALNDTYCKECGSYMNQEDDGDRYIYLCSNMECPSWN